MSQLATVADSPLVQRTSAFALQTMWNIGASLPATPSTIAEEAIDLALTTTSTDSIVTANAHGTDTTGLFKDLTVSEQGELGGTQPISSQAPTPVNPVISPTKQLFKQKAHRNGGLSNALERTIDTVGNALKQGVSGAPSVSTDRMTDLLDFFHRFVALSSDERRRLLKALLDFDENASSS